MINKSDLIEYVAEQTGFTKIDTHKKIEVVFDQITANLSLWQEIRVNGFSIFSIQKKPTRIGTHPNTRKKIEIKASNRPTFKSCKTLKEAVNLTC